MRSRPPSSGMLAVIVAAVTLTAFSARELFGVVHPSGGGSVIIDRSNGASATVQAMTADRAMPITATGQAKVPPVPTAPPPLQDISRVYMPYQTGPAATEVAAASTVTAANASGDSTPSPPLTGRLVLLAGAIEGDCAGRYNVGCKFFHYLRCGVFGHLPVFRWVRTVDEYVPHAAAGDVVVVMDRPTDEASAPPEVAALLAARDVARTIPAGVAVGIYQTADEGKHAGWTWYDRLDLILRNYWVPELANTTAHPTLLHVPIGPAMPNACLPARPADLAVNDLSSVVPDAGVDVRNDRGGGGGGGRGDSASAYCTCPGLPPLARASARPVGYHLSAFVHQSRQDLFDAVAAAAAADAAAVAAAAAAGNPRPSRLGNDTGIVVAHNTFGGSSGTVGSATDDPKIEYLTAMASAALVYVPCGNVMETHRLYEAMATAGVPLVARCEASPRDWMPAPPEELVHGDATGRGAHAGMVATARRLMADPPAADALQAETARRWAAQLDDLAGGVRQLVVAAVARRATEASRTAAV